VLLVGKSARNYQENGFPEGVVVERLGLLEQVIWCQPPNHEDTQMMAEDYLRMAVTRLQKVRPVEAFEPEEPIEKAVLVVGGGVTGLTAAVETAKAGTPVHLVEREDELGGWLAKQYRSVPLRPPFRELEENGITQLLEQVKENPRISVHTSAVVQKIQGAPGLFDVTLADAGNGEGPVEGIERFRVGAVIQATGWRADDPRKEIPWGGLPDVIRNVDLEAMVWSEGKIVRPSDGRPVSRIAFVQCGGAASRERPAYCSSICCLTSLKQALYLRELNPGSEAYIFYEFMRTPGQYEAFYRRVQEDPGIFPSRGEVADVAYTDSGSLQLTVEKTMLGPSIQLEVDLVVLAAGMIPNSADGELIRALSDAKVTAVEGDSEKKRADAAARAEQLADHDGTEILHLDYRQGPDLPLLEAGFPDSHFICFPYETRRTGIYAAGCVRHPMDGLASREDATGAALKAIQSIEMTMRGEAVHPRAGDRSHPSFFLQRCTKCKRCTEECPFGVLNEDEKGTPLLRETRCRRCGVCMGACPERIVAFDDYSVDIVASMIKSIHVPEEWDEKPRILVLACENDAFPALERVAQRRIQYSPFVRVIPVRCLGSVNFVWVTEAMSAGYDGVILMGCPYGDDYQCHFVRGSELAATREKNVREKLEQMAMENERVELHQIQISDVDRIPEIFAEFENLIEEIGMNPFKGM
ncbi:MAG: FAD-dependent oxidoreductase, partial [Acidobacteriota bacterium]